MRWIVQCPAKLNLFLAVGPPDRRGYHPLRTIFQAIDLCDTLEIESSTENQVLCDDPTVPADNTLTKTLRLLPEVVNLPPLRITLHKRIPSQSGLGGGSSDAAGLLRAARHISGLSIPEPELMGLAQTVGADVPFFLVGGRARAEGYGERLVATPDPPEEWIVVARPDVGCDTKAAFQRLDEVSRDWRLFPASDELYNDFELVAPSESLNLISRLREAGASAAGLTGSGSAVFGRCESRDIAESVTERLANEGARVWCCRTLTRSESLSIAGPQKPDPCLKARVVP